MYPWNLTKFWCSIFDKARISFLNSVDSRLSYLSCQKLSMSSKISQNTELFDDTKFAADEILPF